MAAATFAALAAWVAVAARATGAPFGLAVLVLCGVLFLAFAAHIRGR
jgi:hypothetical protein